MKKIYLVDCGHFLPKSDKEYTCYDGVYDMERAYVDEFQEYHDSLGKAQAVAEMFVKSRGENHYGIVSASILKDGEDIETKTTKGEEYRPQDVVYAIARMGGKTSKNFVSGQSK